MVSRFAVRPRAFVLMDNHYHPVLEYVENAVREGLKQSSWESLREQVVLGGAEFLARVKKDIRGHEQEQRGAGRLIQERPGMQSVIGAVEQVKGESWKAFRDRHGDPGRDMVLYLGRHVCGLKLLELAEAEGIPPTIHSMLPTDRLHFRPHRRLTIRNSRMPHQTFRQLFELLMIHRVLDA